MTLTPIHHPHPSETGRPWPVGESRAYRVVGQSHGAPQASGRRDSHAVEVFDCPGCGREAPREVCGECEALWVEERLRAIDARQEYRVIVGMCGLVWLLLVALAWSLLGCGNQAQIADESDAAYRRGSAAYAAMQPEVQALVDAMVARRNVFRQAHAAAVAKGDLQAAQQAAVDYDGLFDDLQKLVGAHNSGAVALRDALTTLATVNRLAKEDTALAGPLNLLGKAVGIPPILAVPAATPPLPALPPAQPVTVPVQQDSWLTPTGAATGVAVLGAVATLAYGGKKAASGVGQYLGRRKARRKAAQQADMAAAVEAGAAAALLRAPAQPRITARTTGGGGNGSADQHKIPEALMATGAQAQGRG